ncbi:putative RNase H-like HicB family nuclease [Enterococcus sp. PF1-24]|uniref:type II toxin-antitoxin system HicB family antitoxin n=1 Tax=unclassified Enterococcus TaxID=2608891 RepID=UPI00247625FA|nr:MULTISPECIES: type II toxin-antitoxin system HicB family antitoxin [unclassified Enterococcus]MDH6364694.1 putative RNase H-like HicB family nuclease [Enterococcus sp. PFB1-1]MDH6401830.1 putative RNase H-like HicB family nuclease [Enterococcus sp. PF1-24]
MLVTYPALFYYQDIEDKEIPFIIHFPDFEHSATQGENLNDAMAMASDWLGLVISGLIESNKPIPKPSLISSLSLIENNPFKDDDDELVFDPEKSFISMVSVDVSQYLGSQEPIKKTLTIPKWADSLGKEMHLNFSKTLTEAIAEKRIDSI